MPLPNGRMTKNQDRTQRYRPGKALTEDHAEYDTDSDEEVKRPVVPTPKPRPTPRSAGTTYTVQKKLPPAPIARQPEIDLEGFVTASESSGDEEEQRNKSDSEEEEEEDSDDDSSEEEESDSEEEAKPRLIAPTFLSKAQRAKLKTQQEKTEDEIAAEEEARRIEKSTAILQAQVEREQAAKAAGRRAWDDDDIAPDGEVDDTDGLDPEAEHAAWKLRELKRIKRDRLALIEKEQEREEVERRKNLTQEERDAEDRDLLEQQKADQEGRGKMAFMQKYYHKGAFFQGDEEQDEEVKAALTRDLAGARFVDESNKEVLPEYMRIRDMTQLGRKSRTKYKDLKNEDTGKWGDFGPKRAGPGDVDDRFRPDNDASSTAQTGANTAPLGARRPRDHDDDRGDEKRIRYE